MISVEKKCIFVHIPKTGGTSIENAIWGPDWSQRTTAQLWMGNIRPGFNKYQSGGLQHLLAKQIRAEVGNERFEEFYKFAFVRNPWDKTVSQFLYLKTRPMLMKFLGLNRWSTFGTYVKGLPKKFDMHVQSFDQRRFLFDETGTQLVDFVGKFERLQTDFEIVAGAIGLADSRLPHALKSKKRKPYQRYYNRITANIIASLYAQDIETFGYDFDDD